MTQNANQNGHGDEILDLMRENDLFAVCTQFKPKRKKWNGKNRLCNATYMPKEAGKRPTKLDYICMSNRWKSMVINSKTRWGPSIHRFGQAFDHGLLSASWRWKTKRQRKKKARNYAAMTENQSWSEFDTALRIKLQQAEDGIRDFCLSRGLGDVYKRQVCIPQTGRFRASRRGFRHRAHSGLHSGSCTIVLCTLVHSSVVCS